MNAWPYRDYVIASFNEDKPYDQFIKEQLAGDALNADAATAFLVGGATDRVKSKDPVLTANQRADELHDMVSTTSATFLGLTLNCARCHDHKFDPIPTKDYYGFVAMLQGVQHGERPMRDPDAVRNEKHLAELRQELAPLETKLASYQPRAHLGRVVLIDDSDSERTTAIEQPTNGQPILYSSGRERGQAGRSWRSLAASRSRDELSLLVDGGRHAGGSFQLGTQSQRTFSRLALLGAWTTHASDARYLLDRDGDLKTTNDQTEIAKINRRNFADAMPAVAEQRRWSGFQLAGCMSSVRTAFLSFALVIMVVRPAPTS